MSNADQNETMNLSRNAVSRPLVYVYFLSKGNVHFEAEGICSLHKKRKMNQTLHSFEKKKRANKRTKEEEDEDEEEQCTCRNI